jgi:acyl carrier protein
MSRPEVIREFIGDYLRHEFVGQGKAPPAVMTDDHDLLSSGVFDSMDFLNLMLALEAHFGQRIDFEGIDPEQMTMVGPFCRFVSQQLSKTAPLEHVERAGSPS